MTATELEVFLHLPGKRPTAVSAEPTETLRALLSRLDVGNDAGHDILVFVGECDPALTEGEDSHKPADLGLTLADLEVDKHHHLHCSRCPEIDTFIHFSGKALNRKFSPATTVQAATQWARDNLRLDGAAASEFVLQLSSAQDKPRSSQHLGELVQGGECKLSFELVKEMTPQG